LREGAVGDALTLNFDLAASTAVAQVGGRDDVMIVKGPEEHARLGFRNLVYLHRNIESDPDALILRPEQLAVDWTDQWEEAVARRLLSGPMTVFVGLGSPAAVLIQTTRWILSSLGGASAYVVDPGAPEASGFFGALGLEPDRYIRLGWSDFMQALAERVVKAHILTLEEGCGQLMAQNPGWTPEDVASLTRRLSALGLVGLGQLRARWLLKRSGYEPHPRDVVVMNLLADLIVGLALLERLAAREARFDQDGLAHFSGPEGSSVLLVVSGQGSMGWERIEAEIETVRRSHRRRGVTVDAVLVAGVTGGREDVVVPQNIAGQIDPASVAGTRLPAIITPDELRAAPDLAVLPADLVDAADGWSAAGGGVRAPAVVEADER
jgi:hypothetical protein